MTMITACFARLADWGARVLLTAADTVLARSSVPNPLRLSRITLNALAQGGSGADFYAAVSNAAHREGFIWGRCENCWAELGRNPDEETALCEACGPWTCACAFENDSSESDCGGCHLTRAGQGEPVLPCACGCDPSPGAYGDFDTESSPSRQHFIDTGRFLRPHEVLTAA
ncbi:hypothetical protein ABZV92_19515 [Streptomyces rubiginosohelvolus]|uniref:hypothetical protein n=1 Tax=Streptomyces rubiginosohelvolus TaxID=67362 RepID=UPI0033BA1CB0